MDVLIWCFVFCLIFFLFMDINFPTPADERSLAIPLTPKQSARLGVIEISIAFCELLLK